jgi:hypothetical protein
MSAVAARLLAVVAWFGVLLQLWLSIRLALVNGTPVVSGLVSYFGYFTVLTNIFVALVCTAGSLRQHPGRRSSLYRLPVVGCSTTAILVVGIGYHALLRETWNPQGLQWVADVVLHYVVPVGALLHWLVYRDDDRAVWWAPFSWCWYPLVYFVYVMLRGEILSSYPYPFIDVPTLGYARTLINALGFLVGFVVLGFALLGLRGLVKGARSAAHEGGA